MSSEPTTTPAKAESVKKKSTVVASYLMIFGGSLAGIAMLLSFASSNPPVLARLIIMAIIGLMIFVLGLATTLLLDLTDYIDKKFKDLEQKLR